MIIGTKRWRLSVVAAVTLLGVRTVAATPSLTVDVDSGRVLHQEEATMSWFPASLTKLMTVYVALHAVKEGRLTLDTPLVVSNRAAREAPSKMGFRPGTQVTLQNALKMLMVKSANDLAVTVAEGVSGSVEDFAAEMNAEASRIGMRESHFDNPNGLPDPQQVSSARDMATVARALYGEFPEQAGLFSIGALQLGNQIIQTHNGLLGRYPGADGMKTGFTCAAGFNIVASATQGSKHVIVVVLGAPSVRERNIKAAKLLDAAFAGAESGSDQLSSLGSAGVTEAPNMRAEACGGRSRTAHLGEEEEGASPVLPDTDARHPGRSLLPTLAPASAAGVMAVLSEGRPRFDPVPVYIGPAPGWTGPVAGPRVPDIAVAKAAPGKTAATPASAAAYAASEKPKVLGNDAAAAATAAAGPASLSGATELSRGHRHIAARGKPAKVVVPVKKLAARVKHPAVAKK